MRRLTVFVLVFLLTAPAASAKGPESVTIETTDGQVVFVDFRPDYRTGVPDLFVRLLEVSRIWYGGGEGLNQVPSDLGPATTLSWVNSGPPDLSAAERTIVQELYLEAPGGPIINTPAQRGTDGWGSSVLGWARVDGSIGATIAEVIGSAGREIPPSDASDGANPAISLGLLTVAVGAVVMVRRRYAANLH